MLGKSTVFAVVLFVGLAMASRNGSGGSHGRQLSLPPFLQNATGEARKEFQSIFKNENYTLAEQKTQVSTWAQKYGKQAEVSDFQDKLKERMDGFKRNATEFVKTLPGKLEELYKIFENENQTRREQAEALRAFHVENQQAASILDFIIRPPGDHRREREPNSRGSNRKNPNNGAEAWRNTQEGIKAGGH